MSNLPFSFANKNNILISNRVIYYTIKTPDWAFMTVANRNSGMEIELVDDETFQSKKETTFSSGVGVIENWDSSDYESLVTVESDVIDLLDSEEDAPAIRLLNILMTEAIKNNASDIHIEPFDTNSTIRFRIDGELNTLMDLSSSMGMMLVSRIKVMAKLDIAEKRLPQDGRIPLKFGGRPVDLRVSTVPISYGERVVMRLLDKSSGRLSLKELGMAPLDEAKVTEILNKPNGIFLVTGPTGSGKTTTLYACLSSLDSVKNNIMTIEDPVEYIVKNISQIAVNIKAGMTFAKGLRAILRQDPDMVMVGEIRDAETAEVAIQSSLTGHPVLSTLHTNTAAGAITRLRDTGIEPFLIASSVSGILAQRLVRRLCSHCKTSRPANESELKALSESSATVFEPCGCEYCKGSGYQGRLGIFELIDVDSEIKRMIHEGCSESEIESYSRHNHPSLLNSGLKEVVKGNTSLSEVLRVTRG